MENSVITKYLQQTEEDEAYAKRLDEAYEEVDREVEALLDIIHCKAEEYAVDFYDLFDLVKEALGVKTI